MLYNIFFILSQDNQRPLKYQQTQSFCHYPTICTNSLVMKMISTVLNMYFSIDFSP